MNDSHGFERFFSKCALFRVIAAIGADLAEIGFDPAVGGEK
ncbi:hypothetical protein SAMN05216227_100628 [Pseudorhodobacter antarcticus]|uniref:Uncharacterized protein n=1 Tax=Pseudorhodobacter antarcticus TaxID=1077947 RepID=A0A1H8D0V0_9RHOB|nr:hypothetical protein SAMN05216227_100628 [Pseudorhodobacter antarcticus]